jgi:DNA polymerase-3 subunit gamma/tau
MDLGPVVTMWSAVLEALKSASRVAHTLADGAVPLSRTEKTLVLAHPDKVRLGILRGNAGHMELLRLAVLDVLHLDVDVDLVLDPEKAASAAAAAAHPPAPAAAPTAPAEPASPSARERATAVVAEEKANHVDPEEDVVSADDPDAEGDLSGLALVQRELGGTVMTEYDNG